MSFSVTFSRYLFMSFSRYLFMSFSVLFPLPFHELFLLPFNELFRLPFHELFMVFQRFKMRSGKNRTIVPTISEETCEPVLTSAAANPRHRDESAIDATSINVAASSPSLDGANYAFAGPEDDRQRCIVGAENSDSTRLQWRPMQETTHLRKYEMSPIRLKRRRTKRETANLPMLACKDEFVRRLEWEKVLVVTAETGSGKTTQLPQYCAEEFPGLVICTQPRVIAAISVARRIAEEFDDAPVGRNVGYEARSGTRVRGRHIMIVTDAALIRMAQRDRLLNDVGVLIIDEAHERSLNTDIVVGIAKTVLRQRPRDFRVVVASATIDPKPFLEFFFDDRGDAPLPPPLAVPGRVFPVTIETRALGKSDDSSASLATEVAKTLKKRAAGHCLVFLQGAREVEAAMVRFQKLAQPNWIALPLYGTLSPEEQNKVLTFDDGRGTLRMVVFCTNVAETSLTVPNVRLVIDTGLAKESRFDAERRMTILEEVFISQSSAEQRKGRAGRTAEGHCVRLFTPETLTRKNIEPEILRSSLDLVMLQVCRLGFSPLEFNFLTRPEEDAMRGSLDMLTRMGCLASSFALTERGRLFNDLPFDPRLSNFVLLAHEEFGKGPVAAAIAAIVSAPGSLLFFGNSKDDRREKGSTGFSSDLLLLRFLYETWLRAGKVDESNNNCCHSCNRVLPDHIVNSDGGCRSCRVKHARANGLNNKVLDFVRGTVVQVQKEIERFNSGCQSPEFSALGEGDAERVIGVCLARCFPEQVCEFIVPSNPAAGVYAFAGDLKGQLSYSSVLRVALPGAKYVVAMSRTKLPSGLVLMDKAHCVDLAWMPAEDRKRVEALSLNATECYREGNVSGRYCSCCRKHFQSVLDGGESYARFVVCQYDASAPALSVFAPRRKAGQVATLCHALVKRAIAEDLAQEEVVDAFNGMATLTVAGGFRIEKMEVIEEQPCRVHFVNPPVKSRRELLAWACKISRCEASDIKWCSFLASHDNDGQRGGSSGMGIVVFRREDVAKMAQRCGGEVRAVYEHGSYRALVKSYDENVVEILHSHDVYPLNIKLIKRLRCQIHIENLPESVDERRLKMLLRRNGIPEPSYVKFPNAANGARNVMVSFNVKKDDDEIISKIRLVPELNSSFAITVPSKRAAGTRVITVTTSCRDKKLWPAESIAFFQKCQEADDIYKLALRTSQFEVDGTSVVIVANPELFLLEKHAKCVASDHGVQIKMGRKLKKGQEIIFSNNLTSKCDEASEALKKRLAPVQYFFGARDKELMGAELLANGKLQTWSKEFCLLVEERYDRGNFTGIYVYGEKYEQGQFMARLAEYYTEFMSRYRLLVLSPTANCLFRKGNPGEAELQKVIGASKSDEVRISYQGFLSSIEIVVKPNTGRTPSVIMQECVSAIDAVLKKFRETSSAAKKCVYCGVHPGRTFRICGHPFCKECLQQATTMQLSNFSNSEYLTSAEAEDAEKKFRELVGSCPQCKTPISIKDLRHGLSRPTVEKACVTAALLQMRGDDHPMGLCPVPECGSFVPKRNGYSNCPSCKQLVCPKCSVDNDSRHGGNTCEEYQQLLKKGTGIALLRSIIRNAEDYARTHLRSNVTGDAIAKIEINPGLEKGCMALRRYCAGIRSVGFAQFERKSLFAWHGTPEAAIPAICDDGFDPRRRSAQLCGPGEYFGIDASTSLSYNKGCQRLIVVQLIKCSPVKEVPNFCYVVNNPTDRSYALNLPLLVVTFCSSARTSLSWLLREKRLLPYPFEEPSHPEEPFGVLADHYVRPTPAPPAPVIYRSNPPATHPTYSYGGTSSYSGPVLRRALPQMPPKTKKNCTIL